MGCFFVCLWHRLEVAEFKVIKEEVQTEDDEFEKKKEDEEEEVFHFCFKRFFCFGVLK